MCWTILSNVLSQWVEKHLTELWSVLYSSPVNACEDLKPDVILIKCKHLKYLLKLKRIIEVFVVRGFFKKSLTLSCNVASQEKLKALYRLCNINNVVCLFKTHEETQPQGYICIPNLNLWQTFQTCGAHFWQLVGYIKKKIKQKNPCCNTVTTGR